MNRGGQGGTYRLWGKRVVDLSVSITALVVLSPVMLLIAIAVLAFDGRPIFFRQVRPGHRGFPFRIVKFRTMSGQVSQADADRTTSLGRWLRRFSLDELPELWNVLRGEMSLIGPRPLLTEYLSSYSPAEAARHDVRPGMTGWAQVNGRNRLSLKDKVKLDLWYVENMTMTLDIRIAFLTLITVMGQRGIDPETGEASAGSAGRT